jgi:predicted transcriptional regulator
VATRTFALVLLNFLHRTDEIRREAYDDDLNTAAIGEAVGIIASEPKRRDPEFQRQFSDFRVIIGVAGQQPSNALSIANATGMPRETVRRKLQNLVKRGILTKAKGGYIMTPGFIQTPKNLALADRAMREAVHFINECFNFGLVRWVDDAE